MVCARCAVFVYGRRVQVGRSEEILVGGKNPGFGRAERVLLRLVMQKQVKCVIFAVR